MYSMIFVMQTRLKSWVPCKSYMRVVCTRCICSSYNYYFTLYIEIDILLLHMNSQQKVTIINTFTYVCNLYFKILNSTYLIFFFTIVFRIQMTNACVLWPRDVHSKLRWLYRHHVPCTLYYWLHCVAQCLVSMWTLKTVLGIRGLKDLCSGLA